MRSMDSPIVQTTTERQALVRVTAPGHPLVAHDSPTCSIAWQGARMHTVTDFLRTV